MTDKPNKAQVGKIGEDTASRWLESKGYKIIERNYWKKWGEIDIVARRDDPTKDGGSILHFIEVKSVSRRAKPVGGESGDNPIETDYLAEDNVHPWKLKRLSRAIQTYLLERKINEEQVWQIDVLTLELDFATRRAKVKLLPDVG